MPVHALGSKSHLVTSLPLVEAWRWRAPESITWTPATS
ncbi:molybdopterin biosynthesis protein MoeA [Cutibacterium acnes JCM 18920]|nr:molybdopterin biosynthesis protein MoeA [Cutibacterium acnes JCM 18920]